MKMKNPNLQRFFYFEKEFLFGLGDCSKNLYGDDQVEHYG